MGSWQISSADIDSNSSKKIWAIEKHSWKANLQGKEKAAKDLGLYSILKGVERNSNKNSVFETKLWTLELNDKPVAYVLVMKRNKALFFAKTSYDSRYSSISPGKFLINNMINQVFSLKTAEVINFITNLPVVQLWKPIVKKRTTIRILRNSSTSKAHLLIFKNRISLKFLQTLDRFKWKKRAKVIS